MKLFNLHNNGGEEITALIGLIGNDVTFDKWAPVIPLGMRDVIAIIGPEPVAALAGYYEGEEWRDEINADADMVEALTFLRQAVALFTWLKVIPTLDAQHDDAGRSRRLGENEKGLTALQEYKDEENITRMAYEAVDALVEVMDRAAFSFWTNSRKYRQRYGLIIQSREEFDEFYNIGSSRLFVTLLPIIGEVQRAEVEPVLGAKYLQGVLDRSNSIATARLRDTAARAVALLTMQKAIERLPVAVIPEGVVQVQISQPVKSYLRADQSARAQVAAALGADATRYVRQLQQIVAELDAAEAGTEVDNYLPGPITHSKGFTF